ncbi:hypothetical protein SFC66_06445 [Terribacillus saccharophilus]|uniref:hypothetical protein n=1 Tax=Terribacillus saccharophilus TaxID=361277 RepID=UPI0039829B60
MRLEGTKHLQLYAQKAHHYEAFIVANKEGIQELIEALNKALLEGESKADLYPSDGEGYKLYIKLLNNNDVDLFESLEMPYTDQFGLKNTHIYYEHQHKDKNAPYHPIILFKDDDSNK